MKKLLYIVQINIEEFKVEISDNINSPMPRYFSHLVVLKGTANMVHHIIIHKHMETDHS